MWIRGPELIPIADRLEKVNMQIITMPVPAQDGITTRSPLLMRPRRAHSRGEPFGLGPVPSLEDPDHRGFEVVTPDPARHTTEIGERQHVALQEGFLGLSGERDVKALPECDSRITNIQHFTSTPAILE